MSNRTVHSLFHRILEEAINQGNLTVVDEVFAPGHVAHIARHGAPNGPQGVKWWIAMLRTAFPDLHCLLEDEIIVGDRIATHWVMRGTQMGMYLGSLPTGRRIEVQGLSFARLENGRIIEDWTLIDQLSILQQLGLIPPVILRDATSTTSIVTQRK